MTLQPLLSIGMFVLTIGYIAILVRKLSSFYQKRQLIEAQLTKINHLTTTCKEDLQQAQHLFTQLDTRLKQQLEQAKTLIDELHFLCERSDGCADKLESAMQESQTTLEKMRKSDSIHAAE